MAWHHDVMPQESDPALAPLPRADVAVMTWTVVEWAALDHVFCDYDHQMSIDAVQKWVWREPWSDYSRNCYSSHQFVGKKYQSQAMRVTSGASHKHVTVHQVR